MVIVASVADEALGVTAALGAEAGERPISLRAVTVKV
jgi:hypothetical protein